MCDGGALVFAGFVGDRDAPRDRALARAWPGRELTDGRAPAAVRAPLEAYFAGDAAAIDRVPVELRGTPFQMRVWSKLRAIGAGTTTSYGAIARALGAAEAPRAVGGAVNRNPIGVVVPCHRVIGKDGSLTGYAGGLDLKRWLLAHEGFALDAARDRVVGRAPRA